MPSITRFTHWGTCTVKSNRFTLIWAALSHALAWAAFLWLALWPHAYQGVSATPVQLAESGNRATATPNELVQHSASIVEVNGLWVLIPLFVPVALTGLALVALLTWKGGAVGIVSILWLLTIALLAFCLLASLSFGALYTPSALALIIAAAILSLKLRLPRVPQE